ncbi:DUF4062 domain-containing protein [Microbacterium sp. NPDC019599]|uniref:ATP-binding protein n=1 Tax=Microbacterium sp. NPDC019599 TaxID=3154690 RepID=UPI0033F67363
MARGPAAIRTPDQRLRVFVSSTLKELEPERRAVRAALEAMHFAPVMFELGARPHPPRELYRSYLAQSDVFVGIYWESYGWTAPDEEVSGLEDEYRLSGALPRLIYIKDPAPARQDRLEALLDRIRADDRTSYKSFADAQELERLVADDLATLLAERFETIEPPPVEALSSPGIPAPYAPIVGRDAERRAIAALLERRDVRIVTLVGPGGIGKSRLAIEIATDAAAAGRDVAFALLEAISSPERAITGIARALGVRDAAAQGSLEDKVIAAVRDRDLLLVVDNMEHLLDAADVLVRLVAGTSRLTLLVTSRSPLHVRAERVVDIGPLSLPAEDVTEGAAEASASVALFTQRAAAVRPEFRLGPDNLDDVVAICRALDGVPLAIELAAARVRLLSPREILARLDSALTLLVAGSRDLPARQRALSETIRWSVELLDTDTRSALAALSVFVGSFTFESAEAVLSASGARDPLTCLEALVDASLLGRTDRGPFAAFRLLSVVRAYAAGLLDEWGRMRVADVWIAHYRDVAAEAEVGLRGAQQLAQLARLDLEIENLGNVMRTLLDLRRFDEAASFIWSLYLFLRIGGYLGIVQAWTTELLETADREGLGLRDRTRAIALYYIHTVRFWQEPGFDAVGGLEQSRDLFRRASDRFGASLAGVSLGLACLARSAPAPDFELARGELAESLAGFRDVDDAWGQAVALVVLGRIDLLARDIPAALDRFEQSLALATTAGERLGIVIAQHHRGWAKFFGGDAEGSRRDFAESLDLSVGLGHHEGIAYGLEAFVGVRAGQDDPVAAGRLLGAAQALRRRKGISNPRAFEFYMVPLQALRLAGLGDELDRATQEGLALTVAEALDDVRG